MFLLPRNSTKATQYIVDGSLLPCWSWASHPGLYSGKHKTTGMNVQVACTLSGQLAWISDAIEGSRQDTRRYRTSHRRFQELGDRAHRLPAPSTNLYPDHLNGHRFAFLSTDR